MTKLTAKQSEVGTIPADWTVASLGDLSSKTTVGFVGSMSHLFTESGVPLLRGTNVLPGSLDLRALRYVSPATHSKWAKSSLRPGDLVMVRVGYPGTTAVVPQSLGPANAASLVIVRPDPSLLNADFAMQVLNSPSGRSRLQAGLVGGAQQVFNTTLAAKYPIALPPRGEQDAIAASLGDADNLIATLERLIAKKHAIKQGVTQQLLTGKTRLPGFTEPWVRSPIRSIVSTPVTDGPHSTPRFLPNGIPFLSVNNLVDGRIDWSDLRYISLKDHEIFSRKCRPRLGDVLLGKAASVGKVAYVDTDREMNIWSPIALIRTKATHSSRFVAYQLQSESTARQIELLTNSSSQGNIGMGEIEKIELDLPPLREQEVIQQCLIDIDVEIDLLMKRLTKARAVKQGMMQQLLTGRTRLPVHEAAS